MDISAASFGVSINRFFVDKVQGGADAVVRRIALQVWNELTKRTPIDTGRAKACWMTNLDEPDNTVLPEGNYPPPQPPDLSKATIKNRIFVTNGVSYIVHLEQGSSSQAPGGMVRIGLAQVQAELETLIAKNAAEEAAAA